MLNDSQKRSLSAALRVLEEALHDAELLLTGGDRSGITFDLTCRIEPHVREKIMMLCPSIRERLQALATCFSLEPEVKDAGRQIYANLFYCWEVLEGVKSRMLKRYGAIEPGLPERLDPQLDALIELLRTACDALQSKQQP